MPDTMARPEISRGEGTWDVRRRSVAEPGFWQGEGGQPWVGYGERQNCFFVLKLDIRPGEFSLCCSISSGGVGEWSAPRF